ncbi:MAG TPA: SPASM domain-containing protein, partial [Nitrospirota bacterium]
DISPRQYEQVLSFIAESQEKQSGLMIRTRCAPTIRRILFEKNPESRLLTMGAGRCLAGLSYCRISPEGDVTPCPYMPLSAGNVRDRDFGDIWKDSELFNALRNPSLKGKCKECAFSLLCGGCRARAYAAHKDYLAEDPWCEYSPQGGDMIKSPVLGEELNAATSAAPAPLWTSEAEERLRKVPSFVRTMVRVSIERYAMANNCSEITPGLMEELKRKSGMGGMHGHP